MTDDLFLSRRLLTSAGGTSQSQKVGFLVPRVGLAVSCTPPPPPQPCVRDGGSRSPWTGESQKANWSCGCGEHFLCREAAGRVSLTSRSRVWEAGSGHFDRVDIGQVSMLMESLTEENSVGKLDELEVRGPEPLLCQGQIPSNLQAMSGPSQLVGTRSRLAYAVPGRCALGLLDKPSGTVEFCNFGTVPRCRTSLNCLRQMDRGGHGPRQGRLILSNSTFPKLPPTSPPAVSAQALSCNHGVFVCSSRSHDSEFLLPLVPRGRRRLGGARFQVVRVLRGTPDRHMARWRAACGLSDQLAPRNLKFALAWGPGSWPCDDDRVWTVRDRDAPNPTSSHPLSLEESDLSIAGDRVQGSRLRVVVHREARR